jgi:hypothetical protein
MFATLFLVSGHSFAKLPFDSSSTTARIQISVNGGLLAGGLASCFSVGSGVACGAVSAVIVTAVDQMYEVRRLHFVVSNELPDDSQVHIDFKSSSSTSNPLDSFGSAIGTANM